MRKITTLITLVLLFVGVANAEVFGVKSSELRTYTLMEVPAEHDTYYIISVHDRNYYYDDVKYYMYHTMELAKADYSTVWECINYEASAKDLIERWNGDQHLTVFKEDFQYLKRDNGSSGYVRITFIGVN